MNPLVDLILDEVLIVSIVTLLVLKAVILRRTSPLGTALARSNIAMAMAYLLAIIAIHFDPFQARWLRYVVRVVVFAAALAALRELVWALGGWRATGREVAIALEEIAVWPFDRVVDLSRSPQRRGLLLAVVLSALAVLIQLLAAGGRL